MRMYGIMAATSLAVGIVAGSALEAATVGYYRFEGDSFLADSSGNGWNLTNNLATDVTQVALNSTTPALAFPNPVPQTEAANGSAASFTIAANTYLTTSGTGHVAAFGLNAFTLEAFVRSTTNSAGSLQFVAGQFNASANQRRYAMVIGPPNSTSTTGELRVALSTGGTSGTTTQIGSSLNVTFGNDYFLAVSVSAPGATVAGQRDIVFYLKDLTANTPLQSSTRTSTLGDLFSASTPFAIGAQGNGGSADRFAGFIDEVRVSDTVLSQSQLLVVPEPASLGLLGMLGAGLIARRRR